MNGIFVLVAFLELLLTLEAFKHSLRPTESQKKSTQLQAGSRVVSQAARGVAKNATFSLATGLDLHHSFMGLSPRQLECEPGFYPCPDGECCEDGTTCVLDGCCPGAEELCGTGCYNPETEVCCEEQGTACTLPDICASNGGCCPEGTELCGTDDCYNPETEVCCASDNYHCNSGEICIGNDRCCPEGQKACGDGCYDPETQVCCADTSTYCEEGYVCVEDGCCPSGMEECGTNWCFNPEEDVCCAENENEAWACKNSYECCNLSAGCYLPETEICCEGGACPVGDTCCGEECCTEYATCGEDGYCTATASFSMSETVSQTPISEPTATETEITSETETESFSETITKSTVTRTTDSQTTTQSTTTTRSLSVTTATSTTSANSTSTTSTASACSISLGKRATPLPTFTISYEEKITVFPVTSTVSGPTPSTTVTSTTVCVDNREILDNMCEGILNYTGCGTNDMMLTYAPSLKKDNRKAKCPKGYCSKYNEPCGNPSAQNEICNPYYNLMNQANGTTKQDFLMSCDEFPFAASQQGGDPSKGSTRCVPGWENSSQGRQLTGLYRYFKGSTNKDYIVEVTGFDCRTRKPNNPTNCKSPAKRDDIGGASITQDDFNFFTNVNGSATNALMMIVGDIDAGIYTYNLNIHSGNFPTAMAVDSEGFILYEVPGGLTAKTTDQIVTFQVDDFEISVSLWAFTSDTEVSVSYNISSEPLPSGNSTTSTTSTTVTVVKTDTTTEPCTSSTPVSTTTSASTIATVGTACSECESFASSAGETSTPVTSKSMAPSSVSSGEASTSATIEPTEPPSTGQSPIESPTTAISGQPSGSSTIPMVTISNTAPPSSSSPTGVPVFTGAGTDLQFVKYFWAVSIIVASFMLIL
ncbi:hypothetical protein BGW36DRAFT_422202 [Talaromyces proteolyticus]|uniref:Deoxyribonuclease NucA/NucB domain-containing protein n=1 Tax=Talaromyces proteolyticus TaxID=1131652 RepID=A0AAD4Q6T5_9EURO|nr:uncharacterized protein BGW36DRAFT_422202 [Talaromyces proteolyticus]KAH8705657.1 hypothetical protein BGW36DRAFT_422202 [Talaromyces proteolyticus]